MATANTEMKERLRLAAARCIVHRSPNWWSSEITDNGEFMVAELYGEGDCMTPEEAANYLLLVAEAIDE